MSIIDYTQKEREKLNPHAFTNFITDFSELKEMEKKLSPIVSPRKRSERYGSPLLQEKELKEYFTMEENGIEIIGIDNEELERQFNSQ